MDEALRALAGARTLVIDVRDNPGGSRPLAIEVAGRFASTETLFSYLRFRDGPAHDAFTAFVPQRVTPMGVRFDGDVYVLTNRHTISAGEDFVLAMRALPRVTVVGDTTAGATGGPMPRELANGWTYQISEWIQYTPDRRIFEDIGLAPDVVAKAASEDARASRDAQLARALELGVRR
jgi:C-terminal processing protease CtpA/Prc